MSPVAGGGLVFIKEAAARSGLHQQTIRLYEEAGLITPERSPGGTRLYRSADIDRLRRIYALSSELGISLQGIAYIFSLEERLTRSQAELERQRVGARRREMLLGQEIRRLQQATFSGAMLPVKITPRRPD